MLLTREACRQKEEEIRKLREKLNEVRREKGEQVAQAPGDNRHDNFGLEQAEIQERAIMNEIRELDAQLKNASIVENLAHKSKQIVQVGDRVKLELNYENDIQTGCTSHRREVDNHLEFSYWQSHLP